MENNINFTDFLKILVTGLAVIITGKAYNLQKKLDSFNESTNKLNLKDKHGAEVLKSLKIELLEEIITPAKQREDLDNFNIKVSYLGDNYYKNHKRPKNKQEFQELFNDFNDNYEVISKYFISLYKFLEFIDDNISNRNEAKKIINDIKDIFILLFYNAIAIIEKSGESNKILLEKYEFFEHLTAKDLYYVIKNPDNSFSTNPIELAIDILDSYDKNVFVKILRL